MALRFHYNLSRKRARCSYITALLLDWNMTDCLSSNTGDRRHKQVRMTQELLTKHVLKAILELVAYSGRKYCTNNQQSGTFVCVISCLIKQFKSNQAHLR